jgi:aspartyl-tRNA(Asn)/glutamyl-tRNA(Gln) amidotransferase subunit B
MVATGRSAQEVMEGLGIREVGDAETAALCRDLLAANPKIVAEVKEGKLKGVGALIGQAKRRNPNVNPTRVRQLCLELIEKM